MTAPAVSGDGPLIFLVAGEPSGDQIGARLMRAMKRETQGRVRFAGVGGEGMAAEGLKSLFPIDELAIMGVIEVLPKIPLVFRRVRETAAAAKQAAPDAFVSIDSPSFTLEVAQRLKGQGFPLIHYVAPSVWAWKAWRAAGMARYLDHLLALVPFEPPYFEKHGLPTTVVGHPVVEAAKVETDPAAFRARHGLPETAPLLAVLPGSRRGEVRRMAPVFGATLGRLKDRIPDLQAVVPTVPNVADLVEASIRDWPVPTLLLRDPEEKYQAFAASSAALAASGTVAVELAVAEVPSLIAYRVNPITAIFGRLLIKVRYASLINLVLDREVQPEFIQSDCRPDRLAEMAERLLKDPEVRERQLAGCREATAKLGGGEIDPSVKAAHTILSIIGFAPTPDTAHIEEKRKEGS